MTTITENPNLDARSRESIAAIEADAQKIIDAGDPQAIEHHIAEVISWTDSIDWAIADHKNIIKRYENADPPDEVFVAALYQLMLCYEATREASKTITNRLACALDNVRAS